MWLIIVKKFMLLVECHTKSAKMQLNLRIHCLNNLNTVIP